MKRILAVALLLTACASGPPRDDMKLKWGWRAILSNGGCVLTDVTDEVLSPYSPLCMLRPKLPQEGHYMRVNALRGCLQSGNWEHPGIPDCEWTVLCVDHKGAVVARDRCITELGEIL